MSSLPDRSRVALLEESLPGSRFARKQVVVWALMALVCVGRLEAALDDADWRAYAAIEESWIRDRHYVLVHDSPALAGIADLDLQLKLADLQRRALRFHYLLAHHPDALRTGCWALTVLGVTPEQQGQMLHDLPAYRRVEERIRLLASRLESHAHHAALRRAEIRLRKTPVYLEVYRRYVGRMQELQKMVFARAAGR